jgi:hypothetical protein
MAIKRDQTNLIIYKTLLYSVLILSAIALISEVLPELESKVIVIPTLLLIITIGLVDFSKLKKRELKNEQL